VIATAFKGRVRDDPRERAFQFPDVRHDPLRQEIDDQRRHGDISGLGLRAQDRDARLEIRS